MILEKVDYPQDLKKLTIKELIILAEEIRKLMVEVVAKKGGHLASSLGATELCIAAHYCLNAPGDDIIFDVGHQAYAHKILTGRKNSFFKLREYGGISGFPNCEESVYDLFTTGHASTAVSWAQGVAEAKKIKNDNSKTVAIIGDGSLTGGMTFEALNNCGHSQSDVLIILNHNEMSISQSVGALSNYLNKIISAPVYNRFRTSLENFIKSRLPKGKVILKLADKFEKELKGFFVPGMLFEELGFRYFGPLDGHNLEILVPTLKNVLSLQGPRILHVITKKGKGYKFSESNCEIFHGTSPFNIGDGTPVKKAGESFSDVFAKKIVSLAESDEKIVAVTAAMPQGTGLDIFKNKFPARFFDVGIAEPHAVSFAAGLAKKGLKPVVAIYSSFLQRSFDQIIHDVALQKCAVIFAVDRAGIVGEDGPTHHGVFDVGYLRLIPGMVCLAPKDKEELEDMLEFAVGLNAPVSIRYPRGEAYSLGSRKKIEPAKSEIIKEGKDACLICLGSMVKPGWECAGLLKGCGIDVKLVNARFIKPLDEELLKDAAENFKFIFTIEEANIACGFGAAVLEFFSRENLTGKTNLTTIGLPDAFAPCAKRDEVFLMYGLDAASLATRIKETLNSKIKIKKFSHVDHVENVEIK
jgi:1-deoxy-D-xylulose-5-phosphate synthase